MGAPDLTDAADEDSTGTVLASGVIAALGTMLPALPPPLCRGRVVSAHYDPRFDRPPSTRALEEVKAAYAALCPDDTCGRGQLVKNDSVGHNAVTWVSGLRDGASTHVKIVYGSAFLNSLNDAFGPGASFGVLAHEVGHHVTAAKSLRMPGESSWNEELRADYLAGCALGRAGRPSAELENALRALASVATKSHPSFRERVPVVRRGYQDCQGQAGEFARSRDTFGLGRMRQNYEALAGCWGYWYRLNSDIGRVGPVAAPRRRARGFTVRAECETARAERATERATEACTCERPP